MVEEQRSFIPGGPAGVAVGNLNVESPGLLPTQHLSNQTLMPGLGLQSIPELRFTTDEHERHGQAYLVPEELIYAKASDPLRKSSSPNSTSWPENAYQEADGSNFGELHFIHRFIHHEAHETKTHGDSTLRDANTQISSSSNRPSRGLTRIDCDLPGKVAFVQTLQEAELLYNSFRNLVFNTAKGPLGHGENGSELENSGHPIRSSVEGPSIYNELLEGYESRLGGLIPLQTSCESRFFSERPCKRTD